jgi:ferredoxin-thioredoxin reductase catalytic chain
MADKMEKSKKKTESHTSRFTRMVAAHKGWSLNPDTLFLSDLVSGLTTNYNRYGYYLCPCRDGEGERDLDKDVVCPCVYAPEDIREYGHCFCGLFLSPRFAESGEEPEQIPERRPESG